MPLGFNSLNHGVIAFGFFNIETDLLLMQNRVFWCRDFCALFTDLGATEAHKIFQARLPAWIIQNQEDLGDLHGSIAGRTHYGLIGELYRRWPFPSDPAGFRQKPAGAATKAEVLEILERFGQQAELEIRAEASQDLCDLGGISFNGDGTRALANYVWRGGMPGWQDGQRPDYLWEAAADWRGAVNPLLAGMALDPNEVGVPA